MTWMVSISYSRCESLRLPFVGHRQYDIVTTYCYVTYGNCISCNHLIKCVKGVSEMKGYRTHRNKCNELTIDMEIADHLADESVLYKCQ